MSVIKEESMIRTRFGRARGLRALLVCLAALIGATVLPGAVSANTYTVSSCNNGVNHAWAPYWSGGSSNVTMGANCPGQYAPGNPAIQYNSGLFVRNISNTSYTPAGGYGGIVLTAPPGNSLASISGDWWVTRLAGSGFYSAMLAAPGIVAGCGADSRLCGAYLTGQVVSLGGSSTLKVEVGCVNPAPGCAANNQNDAIFEVYRADVVINDNTRPSVSPSGSLWTGSWISGAKTVTLNAGDGADGIQRNDLNIDGQTVASQGHGCDYTYVTPCPTSTGDAFTYDTHQLSDGSHAVQAATYDAAWLGSAANGTINVDNHAPDMSSTPVTVAQGTDWTPANGFDLSWTNPDGQAAPIVKAHYSVCQAGSSTTCSVTDGEVAGADAHSISDISLPDPGNYVVRVWLEDAAGNVNSGLASLPVHLKWDPTVPGQAEAAHRNGWLNAREAEAYPQVISLTDGANIGPSGLLGYSISTDGSNPDATVEAWGTKPTYTINDLPEGRTIVKARAVSGARVPSEDIGQTEVDVDKTKPEVSVSGNPDPGQWQRGAVNLAIAGSDQTALSGMQGADLAHGETIPQGAYIEYRLDGAAAVEVPGDHVEGISTESASIPVSADGQHTLTFRAVDFAGNESAEKTAQFKIDQTAPEFVAFEGQDPAHPTTISVAAVDRTSGVAGGVIEMRRQGTSAWTDLPTRLAGDHLVASVDDSNLSPGAYEFRAKARDVAGNETVSRHRRDGSVEVLTAPFRFNTKMGAGIVDPSAKKHQTKKLSAKCRRSKRCVARARKRRAAAKRRAAKNPARSLEGTKSTMTVPFGKSALVKGTLLSIDGVPIASQPIDVYQRLDAAGQQMTRIATVWSNAAGQFDYHAPKGASRTIRFQFDGTEVLHPAAAEVKLVVPASSTLKANKHRVQNGSSVRFSGRIGRPVVDGLKIIDLQAFYRNKWRTFATPRTDKDGAWKYTYRFEATSGVVTYKFRVRVRREASYPYKLGYSKVVKVTVTGR
jgi:hypothetical protein